MEGPRQVIHVRPRDGLLIRSYRRIAPSRPFSPLLDASSTLRTSWRLSIRTASHRIEPYLTPLHTIQATRS